MINAGSETEAAAGAVLQPPGATQALSIRTADSFLTRLKGLMFSRPLQPHEGLLLTRCASVHTAFMRQVIDVVYLDAEGRITKCVERLGRWRASVGARGTAHTLELAAGAIRQQGLQVGQRIEHPAVQAVRVVARGPVGAEAGRTAARAVPPSQRGAAMIEFAVVGPVLTLLGLAVLQYGMLFFAKNQYNHAAFMAARAGSVRNADLGQVREAYIKALVPAYGGGRNLTEMIASEVYARDVINGTNVSGRNVDHEGSTPAGAVRIELLNPTRESFDDWHDPALTNAIGGGRRVIPNTGLAFRDAAEIRPNSGQNIQDANLIKLRITHGYLPKVPLMNLVYTRYLRWLDPGTDAFHTQLVNSGLIPVVTHVTLQMQSHPIEPDSPVSLPGAGNGGSPTNPGDPPVSTDPPPQCTTIGCTASPGNGTPPGGGGDDGDEPDCP